MKLFESNYNEEPTEKLPTLLQYIKSHKGKKRPKSFHISLIWLPNKFPSYGIETDKFRLNCATTSLMGRAIEAAKADIVLSERSIHLGIDDDENGLRIYSFVPGSTKGSWEVIGGAEPLGLKFVAD